MASQQTRNARLFFFAIERRFLANKGLYGSLEARTTAVINDVRAAQPKAPRHESTIALVGETRGAHGDAEEDLLGMVHVLGPEVVLFIPHDSKTRRPESWTRFDDFTGLFYRPTGRQGRLKLRAFGDGGGTVRLLATEGRKDLEALRKQGFAYAAVFRKNGRLAEAWGLSAASWQKLEKEVFPRCPVLARKRPPGRSEGSPSAAKIQQRPGRVAEDGKRSAA